MDFLMALVGPLMTSSDTQPVPSHSALYPLFGILCPTVHLPQELSGQNVASGGSKKLGWTTSLQQANHRQVVVRNREREFT